MFVSVVKQLGAISVMPGTLFISFTAVSPVPRRVCGTASSPSKSMLRTRSVSPDVLPSLTRLVDSFVFYGFQTESPLFLEASPHSPIW